MYKNGLLFLGVGASFFDGCEKTCKVHASVQYEQDAGRKNYSYYQPMINLAKDTGFDENWSNIDITVFRETSQEKLVPFFKKFPKIMEEQLKLARDMIIKANPKIIIVSNALVRDVLKENSKKSKIKPSGFSFEFYDRYGTDIIVTPKELEGRPIFFTSMLSGAGALDLGSFARLRWHIEFVKRQIC